MPPSSLIRYRDCHSVSVLFWRTVAQSETAGKLNDFICASTASFEDKRKENFDKGQAELERRRKALMDIQKKEQVSEMLYG